MPMNRCCPKKWHANLKKNSGQALNCSWLHSWTKKCISLKIWKLLFSKSQIKQTNKLDSWTSHPTLWEELLVSPPSGCESPLIHPFCIIKWKHWGGSGAGNLILCSGGEKRDSPTSLFTSTEKTLISQWLEPWNLADFDSECWKQDMSRQEVKTIFNIQTVIIQSNTSLFWIKYEWIKYLDNVYQWLFHYK